MIATYGKIVQTRLADKREMQDHPGYFINRKGSIWKLLKATDHSAYWQIVTIEYDKDTRHNYVILDGKRYDLDYLLVENFASQCMRNKLRLLKRPVIFHRNGLHEDNSVSNLEVIERDDLEKYEDQLRQRKIEKANYEQEMRQRNKYRIKREDYVPSYHIVINSTIM